MNQLLELPLHHQNPPSLSTMLKCAGRFINTILFANLV